MCMDAENINAASTVVITFVTVIGAAVGFYYNLRQVGTSPRSILILEAIFFISVLFVIGWVKKWNKL